MRKLTHKKRILFIVNVDWFFISHRLPIALEALENGFDVHVACAITDKAELLLNHGVTVHPLDLSRGGIGLLGELKAIFQMMDVIRTVNPDVLHTVTIKPVLYGNLAARFFGVPKRIASISGLGYVFIAQGARAKLFRSFISILYRLALGGANKVIFQNTDDRDRLKEISAIKSGQEVYIRGSGVNLKVHSVLVEPTGAPVVMLVARLLIDKGVNEFVAAAKMLRDRRPDVRMVLVGDVDPDNPKSIAAETLDQWVGERVVEHWGYSHDIPSTIAKANVVVLPSYREGLPKSLIEAAACGRAVVTTNVPGCRDAIEPNKTGLLVPVKSVEPLAEAIITLIDNVDLRHKFGRKGRQLAEEAFDIRDVVKKHIDIYKS